MAKDEPQVNPLQILWNNPEVREHLFTAGFALASAVRAGAEAVQEEIHRSNLPNDYPYLERAVGSLVEAVGGTAHTSDTAAPPKKTPVKKKPPAKKRPVRKSRTSTTKQTKGSA